MNKRQAFFFVAMALISGQSFAGEAEQTALQEQIDNKVSQAEAAGIQPDGDDVEDITIDILDKKVADGEVTLTELEPTYGHYITPIVTKKLTLKQATREPVATVAGNGGGTELGKGGG